MKGLESHLGVDNDLVTCLRSADENLIADGISRLSEVDLDTLKHLFYEDLPKMGGRVDPDDYARLIQTEPISLDWSSYTRSGEIGLTGEYWNVHWACGFDVHQRYRELAGVLSFLSNDFVQALLFIRKQFPKNPDDMGTWIRGWTTFGFDNDRDASGDTTPNRVFRVSLVDEKTRDLPILMMKYLNSPWYDSGEQKGFVDYFRFLTPDVVIARGLVGHYRNNDDHLPTDARAYPFQQFWMQRQRFPDKVKTDYLSTSMLRILWNQARPFRICKSDLHGEWDVDLIMNHVRKNGHGRLRVTPDDCGALGLDMREDGRDQRDERKILLTTLEQDESTAVVLLEGDRPLELRKVTGDGRVLVGKVCFDADSVKAVLSSEAYKKYHYFLHGLVQERFVSQYIEPFEPLAEADPAGGGRKRFCNYYLLRKQGA